MIVMKFGGTSVESAAAIERVAGIVKARVDRHPIVVVSAMGKTTNKLLAIAQSAIEGKRDEYIRQLHDLRDFHSREARQVVPLAHRAELDRTLDDHFQEMTELVKGIAVLGELTPRSIDAISSYGERLSSYIVALAFEHFGLPVGSCRFAQGDRHRSPPHPGRAALRGNLPAPRRNCCRRWRRTRSS